MHLGMSLGNISFPRYEQDFEKTLSDLSPFAVYGATDLMGTGGDIIRLRAGSSEQDFTEAELYGSAYTTFVGSDTPYVVKLYDQVGSRDLQNDTASDQPIFVPSEKSVDFDKVSSNNPILYSDTETGLLYDGSSVPYYSFGSQHSNTFSGAFGTQNGTPMAVIYDSSNAGSYWGYGAAHTGNRMQLDAFGSSSAPPTGGIRALGSNHITSGHATISISGGFKSGYQTSVAKIKAGEERSVEHDDLSASTTNSVTMLSTQEPDRIGIGGWRISSTNRSFDQALKVKASVIFQRLINDNDTADLKNILGGL